VQIRFPTDRASGRRRSRSTVGLCNTRISTPILRSHALHDAYTRTLLKIRVGLTYERNLYKRSLRSSDDTCTANVVAVHVLYCNLWLKNNNNTRLMALYPGLPG